VIVLEDLHVRGMQQNKHLALSIGDASMGELRRQLSYKCDWYRSTLIVADRDENAAINLRAYGLKELGIVPLPEGLREVTPVEEEGSGSSLPRRVKPAR
jgi:transposase